MQQEVTPNKPKNLPGIYVYPDNGVEVTLDNSTLADGFVRVGFVYSRPAPSAVERLMAKQAEVAPATEVQAPTSKAFAQLNKAELTDLAAKEGVVLTEEHDTNAKIRDAILDARAAK